MFSQVMSGFFRLFQVVRLGQVWSGSVRLCKLYPDTSGCITFGQVKSC